MKVLYLPEKYYEDDGGYCNHTDSDIKVSEIVDLDDIQLLRLLDEVLISLDYPNRKNAKKFSIDSIKRHSGLITPGQAKTLDGLQIKDNKFLFPLGGYQYENIEVGADLDDYTVKKIVDRQGDNIACYIRVDVPKYIQDKIDAHKINMVREKKAKERKKKERELEKARKILEKAGEKV